MVQHITTEKQSYLQGKNNTVRRLAFSSLCCHYIDDVLDLAHKNPYCSVEWDLNFIPPTLNEKRIESIKSLITEHQLSIRFHLPYSFIEIASIDKSIQDYSVSTIIRYLNFINKLGGECAILHIGNNINSNEVIALKRLEEISDHAISFGVKICIENLISGLSSSPSFLAKCVEIPNVFVCLDVGHAEVVKRKGDPELPYLYDALKNKIIHSHVYCVEDEKMNHIPLNKNDLSKCDWLNLIKEANCRWCTMELSLFEDQKRQLNLLSTLLV